LRIGFGKTLAAQEVEKDLGVASPHVGVALTLGRLIAEIAPPIDHLLGRAAADAELQPSSGDEIGRARVLRHVERILVAHVDHRRADFDAAGLRTDGREQRKRRGKLAREMMDSKIGAVRPQLLGGDGEIDGLQKRIRGRAGLRLRRGRPVPEREKADLFHAVSLVMFGPVCDGWRRSFYHECMSGNRRGICYCAPTIWFHDFSWHSTLLIDPG
jgi:hypothetical protein